MTKLIPLLIVFISLIVIFKILPNLMKRSKTLNSASKPNFSPNEFLLTPSERSFYKILYLALDKQYLIFPKVRLADVFSPKKGLARSEWQKAFNSISSKHIDFLICNKLTGISAAIELDDKSHSRPKTVKRDDFVNSIFLSCGIPLVRIKAQSSYSISEIKNLLSPIDSPL